jgi:hypothetical protein
MTPDQLFARVHAEHMRDNGALLPHALMAALLRFVGSRVCSSEALAILELLESGVSGGNGETENLIAVSFLEHLEAEEFFTELYAQLGPKLRAAHAPFAWQPPPSQNAA